MFAFFSRPTAPWMTSPALAIVAGSVLAASTLDSGLMMDDVLMRVRLLGGETAWGSSPWWELYTFARPELNADLRAAGLHPWWSDLSVKMIFFRPLSAATHVLDYLLWPDRPQLHHLHSVFWYALAVALAHSIYRCLHSDTPRIVALASLVFAVSAPHVTTVGWLSARNTIIAFVIGCLMFRLHIRGGIVVRSFAVGMLVLGLFASEAMLGMLAYVFAWQVCLAQGSWRRRLGELVPYALVVIVWRYLYIANGFGTHATAIYHDPASDPLDFVTALSLNLPALLGTRLLLVPVDGWAIAPASVHAVLTGLGCASVLALTVLVWPLLRARPRIRFWALGMVLALVPFTATMPMDRLVLHAGLGFSALLASLAGAVFGREAQSGREAARESNHSFLSQRACSALLVLHLPLAAIFGIIRGLTLGPSVDTFTSGFDQAPRDAAVPSQTFVYITGIFHRVHYTTLMRLTHGDPAVPRRSLVLSSAWSGTEITRVNASTLEIAPIGGFLANDFDRIHRSSADGFAVGDMVHLPDVAIEILECTTDGRPARAAFHFRIPLEDPRLRWLVVDAPQSSLIPTGVETRPFALPEVGATVTVRGLLPTNSTP